MWLDSEVGSFLCMSSTFIDKIFRVWGYSVVSQWCRIWLLLVIFLLIFKYLFIYCICVWEGCVHSMLYMWKKKDNLGESDLSFYHVCPRDQTQVVRLHGRCLFQLSHLTNPLHSPPPCASCKRELSADRSEYKGHFHLIVITMELELSWWNTEGIYSVMDFLSPNRWFPIEWVCVIKIFLWLLVQVRAICTRSQIKWPCQCLYHLHKATCNFHFNFWHFFSP